MLKSLFWKPYSWLLIVGDNAGWAIDEEAAALLDIAKNLNIPAEKVKRVFFNIPQAVHYTSQFALQYERIYKSRHHISVDYYHGKSEQESFKKCFEALRQHHEKIKRVRVSTKEMEAFIKSSGIDPGKVMRIPIGIDLEIFKPQTPEKKQLSRLNLDIPKDAIVIGSFQKDGVGWNDGNEPKLIKGPDVFLKVIEKLKKEVPDLWVLLSGPSRGFVKNGLEKIGVPYRHQYLPNYKDVSNLYDALDLYIITSREEGGPKACLESMAKGVPLVTTAVGQCRDLVQNGENAMMTEIDNVSELTSLSLEVLSKSKLREKLVLSGYKTARGNSYNSQLPSWKQYLEKLIDG